LRLVSLGALDEVAPAWGPGDREIAFARIGRDGSCKIIIRSLLSMTERAVDTCSYERYHRILDWSRDGRFLFYSRRGLEAGVISIYRHELASGDTRRISFPNAGQEDKQIAVSPAGRLAFVRHTGATADAYLMEHDVRERQLTH
jgi:Tol biopolymer transport system component